MNKHKTDDGLSNLCSFGYVAETLGHKGFRDRMIMDGIFKQDGSPTEEQLKKGHFVIAADGRDLYDRRRVARERHGVVLVTPLGQVFLARAYPPGDFSPTPRGRRR